MATHQSTINHRNTVLNNLSGLSEIKKSRHRSYRVQINEKDENMNEHEMIIRIAHMAWHSLVYKETLMFFQNTVKKVILKEEHKKKRKNEEYENYYKEHDRSHDSLTLH